MCGKWKRRGKKKLPSTCFFVYMMCMAVAFYDFPRGLARAAGHFPTGILYIILGAVVAVPALFAKRYFTEYFARKRTPEAVWEADIFWH